MNLSFFHLLYIIRPSKRLATFFAAGLDPGKISQVGVGGVFGEDYLRIDASHTLEVAGAAVVEIDSHASGYPK